MKHVFACNFAKYSPILIFFTLRLINKPFLHFLARSHTGGGAIFTLTVLLDISTLHLYRVEMGGALTMPGLQHKGQRKYNDRKRCNGPRQNRALQPVVRAYSRHQSALCELYRHICVPYGSRTTTSLLKSIMSCTLYCDKRGFWAILLLVINTINKNKLLSDSL